MSLKKERATASFPLSPETPFELLFCQQTANLKHLKLKISEWKEVKAVKHTLRKRSMGSAKT